MKKIIALLSLVAISSTGFAAGTTSLCGVKVDLVADATVGSRVGEIMEDFKSEG